MRLIRIPGTLLTVAVVLFATVALAQDNSLESEAAGKKKEISTLQPQLADVIPLAAKLSGRLAALKTQIPGGLDVSGVESSLAKIEVKLAIYAEQLQQLSDSKGDSYTRLVELRQAIDREENSLTLTTKPLRSAISQLGSFRREWLADKENWKRWQSLIVEDGEIHELKSTFLSASRNIDTALNLLNPRIKVLLAAQKKAGGLEEQIYSLDVRLKHVLSIARHSVLLNASPLMFSSQYFSQFGRDLWHAAQGGLGEISWQGIQFLEQDGGKLLFQLVLSLFVIIAIYRNRRELCQSERWSFLSTRPFSAGIYIGIMAVMVPLQYEGISATWALTYDVVGGLCLARLLTCLTEVRWKRQFVWGLIIVWLSTGLLYLIRLPLPLFRFYTLVAALAAVIFLFRWARASRCDKAAGYYPWLLQTAALFFAFIAIAEIFGKEAVASYLFLSLLRSVSEVLAFVLLVKMIYGCVEYLSCYFSLKHVLGPNSLAEILVPRIALLLSLVILAVFLLPTILMIWGVYATFQEAVSGFLSLGGGISSQKLNVGLIIVAASTLYGSYIISSIVQELLLNVRLVGWRAAKGVRISIARLVYYVIILCGFLLTIGLLGFEFSKMVILLSAFGVGIGFGLQSIVNNFISGLILLFEQPIRVGDSLEFEGKWVDVRKIGLRATTVQTLDHADVIVPNADLVTNAVTNWTLGNRRVRITIPVGVAYGSDVPLVMETLLACASENTNVIKKPAPQVMFLSFGESSLDFDLRVWIMNAEERLSIRSELHQEIDKRFREAGIEIAFPQRDLHLRSTCDSIGICAQPK